MRFLAMANQYVFEPEVCNPAAGLKKGQVEKSVQDARPRLWNSMPTFCAPKAAEETRLRFALDQADAQTEGA